VRVSSSRFSDTARLDEVFDHMGFDQFKALPHLHDTNNLSILQNSYKAQLSLVLVHVDAIVMVNVVRC